MKGLKIVTSVLLLAVICTATESEDEEEMIDQLKKFEAECLEESGMTKDDGKNDMKKICAGEELDKKAACSMACFYKKIEVIKDGEIVLDDAKKSLLPLIKEESERKEIETKLDNCQDSVKEDSDDCDTAVEFTKCLVSGTQFCQEILQKG